MAFLGDKFALRKLFRSDFWGHTWASYASTHTVRDNRHFSERLGGCALQEKLTKCNKVIKRQSRSTQCKTRLYRRYGLREWLSPSLKLDWQLPRVGWVTLFLLSQQQEKAPECSSSVVFILLGTEQMDSALVPHLTLETLPEHLAARQGSGCTFPLYLAASWWPNVHCTPKQTHSKLLSSSLEYFKTKQQTWCFVTNGSCTNTFQVLSWQDL